MQIRISINVTNNPCELPLGYHHILQGAIYNLMCEPMVGLSTYHDDGASLGSRTYKLFTFGLLHGKYRIENKHIIFVDSVDFEVRSSDEHCIRLIEKNVNENGIVLGKNRYTDVSTELDDYTVETDNILVKMNSPICVYATDEFTKKTMYFNPSDKCFANFVADNFVRKYVAAYEKLPDTKIVIEPVNISPKDKYLTKYKGFVIEAWKGEYQLYGERKHLDFLYQTGLGAKNSMGFGMFEVKNRDE